jgi:molybdopterin-guanine dinucleotide biosynthesis protein A
MRLAGFVLAGGSSRRMGRDKALLPYRGTTLIEWVADLVRQAAGSVCLAGGGARYSHLGLPWIEEPCPGLGPLSGIHAALASGRGEWSLIAACDMPGLSLEWLRKIIEQTEKGEAAAVVTRTQDGWAQPLAAAYHRSLLGPLGECLANGRLKVSEFLQSVEIEWLTSEDRLLAASVNTPEEWSQWSR